MPVTTAEIGEARAVATGALSGAILGTALPTDSSTALPVAFKPYGYIGNDGIQQTRDLNTDDILDMNGDIVYVVQQSVEKSYEAELLQYDNVDLKKDLFGSANVTTTAATASTGFKISLTDKGEPAPHKILSIDTFRIGPTGVTEKSRIVVPDAQPVTIEQGPLRAGAVRSYTVTWRVFKNAAGVYCFEYDDDGVFV
jgi:hypothetical protein